LRLLVGEACETQVGSISHVYPPKGQTDAAYPAAG
jgi:hypothetical protein